jgi:hypothetical protein
VRLASILQSPLIADPLSGGRRTAADLGDPLAQMAAGVALLACDGWLSEHMPRTVVLLGELRRREPALTLHPRRARDRRRR